MSGWVKIFLMITWFYLPLTMLVAILIRALKNRRWLIGAALVVALWLPIGGAALGLWPIDIFVSTGRIRGSVMLPGYRVDYITSAEFDENFEYFEVIRADGKRAILYIDGDANKCENFRTSRQRSLVYFICDGGRSSYVDVEQQLLFAGYEGKTTAISELEFE